ncbi:hypothetical protein [Bacillus sp. X1(2014)]|uniref:hypothetical protein n=1 Tax=Bacillus sp. X1(2014) TaxID=1565991 RepID=UPI0011A9173E|nr:hypothetical protein [Bacillus sp. X1(2014)]
MKIDLVPTTVVQSNKNCVFCGDLFDYLALVNGENILEELKNFDPQKAVTDQVVVLKKSSGNSTKQQNIDLEITVRCPHCNSNNRFTGFFGDADKLIEF